ncbi:hypothetical protein CU098_004911, partial [Rhizopus stolonifer]
MTKRKAKSENIYDIWLQSANKLDPPYDYFSFAELSNSNEHLTNNSYHNLLLKALSKASMLNTNNITNAINVFKKRNVPSTGFNKSYVGYWNSRSTAINSIHLRG